MPSNTLRRRAAQKAFLWLGPLIFLLYLFNYSQQAAEVNESVHA